MTELLTLGGLLALVAGLTEVAKRVGCPKRFLPLKAIGFGVVIAIVGKLAGVEMAWGLTVLTGIALGLMASGAYDVGKVTVAGK